MAEKIIQGSIINPEQPNTKESDIPEQLRDGTKTKVTNLRTIIEEKILQLKDLATVEHLMPVNARMRNRLKSVKEMGSAHHIKIRGHTRTTPPQMHICNLQGHKISNDEAEVSWGVFEMDKNGNKVLHENSTIVTLHDGSSIQRTTSAEYRVAYEVTERIRQNKPITREIMKTGDLN